MLQGSCRRGLQFARCTEHGLSAITERIRCGARIVRSIGGRCLAALAVTFGLAMLGFGPRASASFLPLVTQPSAGVSEEGAGPSNLDERPAPARLPEVVQTLHGLAGEANQPAGGAGPSPTSAGGASGQAFTTVATAQLAAPDFAARLRYFEAVFVPDPIISAIFEPPRAGR